MLRNLHLIGIGAFCAVLIVAVATGCTTQNNNPDNIPVAPTRAVNTITVAPGMNTATGPFGDAANTWSRVEEARAELDAAIKARKLDQVHESTTKIRDLVKTLPDKSLTLPEDKRKTLDDHVRNVGELTAMMDKFDDPTNMKSAEEHQRAMNDALDMIKGIYPAEAMRSSMHMPEMNTPGKDMPDSNMPGKGMGGVGKPADPSAMAGMGDKMGGMGKRADPGKMAGMGDGMSNMSESAAPDKMAGMGMMDKMLSGMSAMDQNEMKTIMDKMSAMPPAARKKAMQKMSGTDPSADPAAMSGDM